MQNAGPSAQPAARQDAGPQAFRPIGTAQVTLPSPASLLQQPVQTDPPPEPDNGRGRLDLLPDPGQQARDFDLIGAPLDRVDEARQHYEDAIGRNRVPYGPYVPGREPGAPGGPEVGTELREAWETLQEARGLPVPPFPPRPLSTEEAAAWDAPLLPGAYTDLRNGRPLDEVARGLNLTGGELVDLLRDDGYAPPNMPVSTGDNGQAVHTVGPGGNLTGIAGQMLTPGRPNAGVGSPPGSFTVVNNGDDTASIVAPPGRDPGRIYAGDQVTVLDPERSRLVAEQQSFLNALPPSGQDVLLNDPAGIAAADNDGNLVTPEAAELVARVAGEIGHATINDPTPGDVLPDLLAQLRARRPDDAVWTAAVDQAGIVAAQSWEANGRTHEDLDPLYWAALQNDNPGIGEGAKDVYRDKSNISLAITRDQFEGLRDSLLEYGPQGAAPAQAVNDATVEFLDTDPQRLADEVAATYDGAGPSTAGLEAAQRLADATDPTVVDPYTAAEALQRAQPTVDRIITDYFDPADYANADGLFSAPPIELSTIVYGSLSSAVESAERTPEGRDSTIAIGDQIVGTGSDLRRWSPQIYSAVSEGHGATLSLELARQLNIDSQGEQASAVLQAAGLQPAGVPAGVRVDDDTFLRSPTYELAEPGKIREVLLENGGSLSIYVGTTVEIWERPTDLGPIRSPSHLIARGPTQGRLPGGSTALHEDSEEFGLRIELKGRLKDLLQGLTRPINSTGSFGGNSPAGTVEVSPSVTVGEQTYTQGDQIGLRINAVLSPELEAEINFGQLDAMTGQLASKGAISELLRQIAANIPISESAQEELINNDSLYDGLASFGRVGPTIEPYLSERLGLDPNVIHSTRLGLSPTVSANLYIEGQPLLPEGDAPDLTQPMSVPWLPFPVMLSGPSLRGPYIAQELGERLPFGDDNVRVELSVSANLSGYVFISDKAARGGIIPQPPLTASVANNAIGITASASLQVVYEPPVALSTEQIAAIQQHEPVVYERDAPLDDLGTR